MARLARLVVPHHPHHVTQRGNRRQDVFFWDADYQAYLDLLQEWAAKAGTDIWAYCLMPNHVHLVLVPTVEDGLRATLGETHRRYTSRINKREHCTGHLWQDRFGSFPMDEAHLMACVRYIEQNPVRAGLVKKPQDWAWSSARAHLDGRDDGTVVVEPMLSRVPDWPSWGAFLAESQTEEAIDQLRQHSRTGRPMGDTSWVADLEQQVGRRLGPKKRGPKPRP
jgi:putative transposase